MSQVFRVVAILVVGLAVYVNVYEKDEVGLMPIFAYGQMLIVAFIVGVPIVFMRNSMSVGRKVSLLILPLCILMIVPLFGFGNVKYIIEENRLESEVEQVEAQYNVTLQKEDAYIAFDKHLISICL